MTSHYFDPSLIKTFLYVCQLYRQLLIFAIDLHTQVLRDCVSTYFCPMRPSWRSSPACRAVQRGGGAVGAICPRPPLRRRPRPTAFLYLKCIAIYVVSEVFKQGLPKFHFPRPLNPMGSTVGKSSIWIFRIWLSWRDIGLVYNGFVLS
jgi:hypothetical protein